MSSFVKVESELEISIFSSLKSEKRFDEGRGLLLLVRREEPRRRGVDIVSIRVEIICPGMERTKRGAGDASWGCPLSKLLKGQKVAGKECRKGQI